MEVEPMKKAEINKEKSTLETMKFTKRIGTTKYLISVNFSDTNTETMKDKIMRLIENEVRNSA